MSGGSDTDATDHPVAVTLAHGGAVGVLAAVVVALGTFLVVAVAVDPPESTVPAWKGVAWYALDGHFVPIEQRTGGGDPSRVDLLADAGTLVAFAVRAVPPVVLAAAGALLARFTDGAERDAGVQSALAGAAVSVGYLPVVAVAAVATTHVVTVDLFLATVEATVAPARGRALLAGAAYPLAFGALGGALLAVVRRRRPPVPGGGRGEH